MPLFHADLNEQLGFRLYVVEARLTDLKRLPT